MFMTVLIFNKRLCLIFIHLNDFLYIQKPFLPGVFYKVVRKTSLAVTPAAAHPVYLPLIPLLTLLHVIYVRFKLNFQILRGLPSMYLQYFLLS